MAKVIIAPNKYVQVYSLLVKADLREVETL